MLTEFDITRKNWREYIWLHFAFLVQYLLTTASASYFKILWQRWKKLVTNKFIDSFKSSHLEVFLGKGVLEIYSNFTVEHSWRRAISIKLLCNFMEIALRHWCSPVNMLHIFRTPFPKNTSRWLLLFLLGIKEIY